MTKTINFGKIDYNKTGRKINEVTVELELEEKNNGQKVFSCRGNIWNSKKTDIICGGQCLDKIAEYIKTPLFNKISKLWRLYHLNDSHAGTKKQEEFLKKNNITSWANQYDKTCKILAENNLLVDDGHKFGSDWLYEEIPAEDLKKIQEILGGEKYD